MRLCKNCGKPLNEGAKFCSECGAPVTGDAPQRQVAYDGEVRKCPNCGEIISSFVAICPTCGYELRGQRANDMVHAFTANLLRAPNEMQKINLIRTFPIPNTREDILEFMFLATSNFDAAFYVAHLYEEDVSDAWLAKIEQCYQKAKMTLNSTDMMEIDRIYASVKERIASEQTKANQWYAAKKEEQDIQKFKKGGFRVALIVFSVVAVYISVLVTVSGNIAAGSVAAIMALLFFLSILLGDGVIKGKVRKFRLFLPILAFLLCIPYSILSNPDLFSPDGPSKMSPTITESAPTSETEGIYSYEVRNYIGKNVASVGETYGEDVVDNYGSGKLRIVYVSADGITFPPDDDEVKRSYRVVAQNIEAGESLIVVHLRDSWGKPYDNLVDYQSYEEIVLYVAPVGDDSYQPTYTTISPTLDKHTFHVRDYVGRNAASFGKVSGDNRIDEYGAAELKITFIPEDGSYIDAKDYNVLKNYIVVGQDIEANSEIDLNYLTDGDGNEFDNLIGNQNYEEINLAVKRLDYPNNK